MDRSSDDLDRYLQYQDTLDEPEEYQNTAALDWADRKGNDAELRRRDRDAWEQEHPGIYTI